jgi:hypothetical protein
VWCIEYGMGFDLMATARGVGTLARARGGCMEGARTWGEVAWRLESS